MKIVGIISTAVLSLILGIAAPVSAQEQHDQEEQKGKQEENKAQQEQKTTQQQDKNAKQEEKTAQQQGKNAKQEERTTQQQTKETRTEQVHYNGRIPEDHFRASFGREHVFVINQPVIFEGRPRFQYGGYWFGFGEPWPVGWAYTDNVYVDYVDGEYYLYNPVHPGIRIVINVF